MTILQVIHHFIEYNLSLQLLHIYANMSSQNEEEVLEVLTMIVSVINSAEGGVLTLPQLAS